MKYIYSFILEHEPDGSVILSFPDIPEAHTQSDSEEGARANALDSLVAALGGYIELRRVIPWPSRSRKSCDVVILPPLIASKLALYQAMRDAGLTAVALAQRLGVSEGAVRRLLDLDHRSHIGQVEAALAALGKRLTVEVCDEEWQVASSPDGTKWNPGNFE